MNTTTVLAAKAISEETKSSEINVNKEIRDKYIKEVNEKFGVPTGYIMDYISGRSNIENASAFDMFMLAYGFDKTCGTKLIEEIFTKVEIREFGKSKFAIDELTFPIQIECLPVTPYQWIGTCDTDFLIKLGNKQIINYNVNAQRAMQRVVRHGDETYKISINKRALKEIKESFESEQFIPNTITLNIPEGEEDFSYDATRAILKINSIKHLDISDGYHRYLAIFQAKNENPDFNYHMELRITHFPDSQVKQFIFQEDQKTKMRKIDSQSMNMYAPENLVTERLNKNTMFYYYGNISHGKGAINFSEFAECVKYFYFRGRINERDKAKAIRETEAFLCNRLNEIFPIGDKETYDFRDLQIIFTGINLDYGKDVITSCIENKESFGITGKEVRKGVVNGIEKGMKEYVQRKIQK